MAISTTYDVRLRYMMDDRASRGMRGLERNAKSASGMLGRVTSGLVGIAAAGFGINKAAGALIGYNASVQDVKLQIAGMLALAKKTDLSDQLKVADKVFSDLQTRAKSLPGTTAEYVKMAGMITQPIIDAGLGMKDLEDLTVNAVVAAKALGIEADVAARDIDQAIRGQFHSVDVFSGKILGSMGFKGEEGRAKFNAMGQGERASTLKAALMQKQLTQLAAAQGQTFNGIWSTFKDNLEQTLGKVGIPLFRALSNEVKGWNTWLDANGQRVEQMAASVGSALATGFGVVKDAVGFLVDHAGLLLAIGKVWIAVKAANAVGGLIGRGGAGLSSMLGALQGEVGFTSRAASPMYGPLRMGQEALGGAGGRTSLLGAAPALIGALASGYEFGKWLEDTTGIGKSLGRAFSDLVGHTNAYGRKLEQVQASMSAFDRDVAAGVQGAKSRQGVMGTSAVGGLEGLRNNLVNQAQAIRAIEAGWGKVSPQELQQLMQNAVAAGVDASEVGLMNYQDYLGKLDGQIAGTNNVLAQMPEQFSTYLALGMGTLTSDQVKALDQEKAQAAILKLVLERLNKGLSIPLSDTLQQTLLGAVDQDQLRKIQEGKTGTKPKVNVTIQHFEVQSDDPDRFAFGFVEALRDTVKNPSGALDALREG